MVSTLNGPLAISPTDSHHQAMTTIVQSASGIETMQSLEDNIFLARSYSRKNFFLMLYDGSGRNEANRTRSAQRANSIVTLVEINDNIL